MTVGSVAFIAPDESGWVELARTPSGKLFRKPILTYGPLTDPRDTSKTLDINEAFADALIKNYNDKVCPIVQIPVVGDDNKHTEDPLRNIGQVVGIEKTTSGVDAILDVRKHADDVGQTLIGASALMSMDYLNTKTKKKVGPTLLHVAVTNRPFVNDLGDFEEVIAASADTLTNGEGELLFLTLDESEGTQMDLDELLAELKDKHDIDVAALQAAAKKPGSDELVTALSAVLKEAGVVSLSNTTTGNGGDSDDKDKEVTIKDVADAVIELSQEKVALSAKVAELTPVVETLRQERAEAEINDYIKQGRILPTQRDAMLKLSQSDRETFDAILPADSIVAMSEIGVTVHDEATSTKYQEEVERLAALASSAIHGKG